MVLFTADNRLYREGKVGALSPVPSFLYPITYFTKISACLFPLISVYKGIQYIATFILIICAAKSLYLILCIRYYPNWFRDFTTT